MFSYYGFSKFFSFSNFLIQTSRKLEKTPVVTICSSLKKSGLKNGFTQNLRIANLSKKTPENPFLPLLKSPRGILRRANEILLLR